VSNIDHAAYFRAAGDEDRVGGDFYDLFEVSDGRWALTVGDVGGKGARAAALTALARHTLRAVSTREPRPSRVLASLNDAIRRQHDHPGATCTAIYATLELTGRAIDVRIASAGHPLPLILRGDGSVAQLGEPGSVLGLDPNPSLSDHRAKLAPGDTILVYTDGLTDAFAPYRIVEPAELQSILRSCAGQKPRQLIAAIEHSLLTYDGLEPRDDIAILALQVTTPPTPPTTVLPATDQRQPASPIP
jgi:serine phosphatase RsbU (regulator of sigma subunit)